MLEGWGNAAKPGCTCGVVGSPGELLWVELYLHRIPAEALTRMQHYSKAGSLQMTLVNVRSQKVRVVQYV
jgi:hypothetical protein